MNRTPAFLALMLAWLAATAVLSGSGMAVAARAPAKFDGFNERFNLGQSSASHLVCEATRTFDFDNGLVSVGVRAWDVSCRGWPNTLGRLYLFPAARRQQAQSLWRDSLAARTDCGLAASVKRDADVETTRCKTKTLATASPNSLRFPEALDYVTLILAAKGGVVAAEGVAPIDDMLTTGMHFIARTTPEPQAIAEQAADVSQVVSDSVRVLRAADASTHSVEDRRQAGYQGSQDWDFDQAESIFSELATPSKDNVSSPDFETEAVYNLALNASNNGHFAEATDDFSHADDLASAGEVSSRVRELGLNYRAAHERNQANYAAAIDLAKQAIAARATVEDSAAVERNSAGDLTITEVGGGDTTDRLSDAERSLLTDAQAREIEATSEEALGQIEEARKTLALALKILDASVGEGGQSKQTLGEATPWLNTLVLEDIARVSLGAPMSAAALARFKEAVATFGRRYPGSMPFAGFLIELARDESAGDNADKVQQEAALLDFESATQIFVRQRGSLGPSADLVQPYFDILIKRIGGNPEADAPDVSRFFIAAQAIAAQSSAEAAKREAAQAMAGDQQTTILARTLDATEKQIDEKVAEQRQLEQQGSSQNDAKARLNVELQALLGDAVKLQFQLFQADPRYASALRKTVSIAELQKVLRPGEVYLKVFLLADRGYGILVSPDKAKPFVVDLTRNQARDMVDALRAPIDARSSGKTSKPGVYDVALAHDLFDKTFGPVRSEVLQSRHVIFEPDARLIGIPIAALVVDDASAVAMKTNIARADAEQTPASYVGVDWLGARVTSSIALSASSFVQIRQQPAANAGNHPFIGFGDPIISTDPRAFAGVQPAKFASIEAKIECDVIRSALYRLAPLPETADEVKAIAASLGQDASSYALGADFTDSGIVDRGRPTSDLHHYKVLYFATHGILPQPYGCVDSALITSLGDGASDELLDLKKIGRLQLDADMVVLAACDTGRSAQGDGSEALGGLVTTFVNAGARNVVASSWSVYSQTTVKLMTAMFSDKGVTQAEALARAERALMVSPDQYSNPYYWAPFILVGDGDRPMPAI